MLARERELLADVRAALHNYDESHGELGKLEQLEVECLALQIVDSVRRNWFFDLLMERDQGPRSCDFTDEVRFDPLRASIYQRNVGNQEEAIWLVFLATHFGKHQGAGWEYARRVYGALGLGEPWTWGHVSEAPEEFRDWLDQHNPALRAAPGGFGNHRKFESLSGRSEAGTGAVVASYIDWSGAPPSQVVRISEQVSAASGSPAEAFDRLYRSLSAIKRFGRLAKFDYLNTLRRLGFAVIEPGKVYFQGASGPLRGAKLLWGEAPGIQPTSWYEAKAAELREFTGVGFDVIEDALCNWQKSPKSFRRFAG